MKRMKTRIHENGGENLDALKNELISGHIIRTTNKVYLFSCID